MRKESLLGLNRKKSSTKEIDSSERSLEGQNTVQSQTL